MLTLDITTYLNEKSALVESHLNGLVQITDAPYSQLFEAARYSLLGNGKRLRPILCLATTATLGTPETAALAPACALEMIHTYSLIHDDLPCMDDDDFRRGKPSLHKAFGEGHAVLTGDFLLTHAFEVITNDPHLSPEKKVALIQLIAQSSGAHGMIGGQVMDIEAEDKAVDLETLKLIHRCKTGALLTASILCGAIVANASVSEMETLRLFGSDIGLAFQIVDDILDVTASEKKHGKKVASDVANNKTTYVTLMGIETAQKSAQNLFESAIGRLSNLNHDTTLLQALAKRIVHRSS